MLFLVRIFMAKTLKDIIKNSSDIYQIEIIKPSGNDKYNHSSWKFNMVDPRWTDKSFNEYRFKTVHLRRDSGFFLAYKSDDSNAYFVDPKRAMYRNSISKYVYSIMDYSVKTNDISFTKNDPSVRITKGEMKHKKIDNFLDLCYTFRDYTAIGTGYTRDIRNLIVMDIDVDCTKPDNVKEINSLLILFAKYKSLPDFYIFNEESKHIQLQWVIKDLQYKDINQDTVDGLIDELKNDKNRNREVDFRKIEFTDISKEGVKYRRYTRALCDIVKGKRKFGDKNYTFWKAKNPMSALIQTRGLELKMPYIENGEICFRTDDEMNAIFSSKESRKLYYNASPTMDEWYEKLKELLDPLLEKITEKKVMKLDDANDVTEIKEDKVERKKTEIHGEFGESRNTFVMEYTRFVTKKLAKKYGYRTKEAFSGINHEKYDAFKKEAYDMVYKEFKKRDFAFGGRWPDTTNISSFTNAEFKKAFDSSFSYIINNNIDKSFTAENREHSQLIRERKRDIKLIIVDRIRRNNLKIKRKDLLDKVNKELNKLLIKKTTMGSLKRFIAESNELTDEDRIRLTECLIQQKEWVTSINTIKG